jgi:phospholipid transport system substrate-binding protein
MRPSRLAAVAGLAIALTLSAQPGLAADNAVAVVTQFSDKTLQIINDPQIPASDRERRFHALVDEYFDIPWIARFVMGRYWQAASEDERRQFTEAFEDHMVRAYVARFRDYSGETFRVMPARREDETGTIVPAEIRRPGNQPRVVLDWRVQKGPAGLRIRDVSIDGISMALTYRDEMAAVIQRSNGQVAILITALRDKSGDE